MALGSKRSRGGDEYIFIDGRALRADESVRIELDDVAVPGQDQAAVVPGQGQLSADDASGRSLLGGAHTRQTLRVMEAEDAFVLNDDFTISLAKAESLMVDDRRKLHRKYLSFGVALLVVALLSLCISEGYYWTVYSPADTALSLVQGARLWFVDIFNASGYWQERAAVLATLPMYQDVCAGVFRVLKYLGCGALLALSGMLYQNAFRNPIAAPSMLGVSNGINIALLVLVMQFGYAATGMMGLYYLYSFVGGVLVLLLVLAGGKWMSGKNQFNVVDMILVGTILSQLLGLVSTYVQNTFMGEQDWNALYLLQNATGVDTVWTYVSLAAGFVISLVPVVIFRFRLNLISFSDEETRLLGVDPNKLRLVALGCGSLMILVAQVNAGQVAMVSLVIPFVVRAVFGSEFRKQLGGNLLMGALIMVLCSDLVTFVNINGIDLNVGSVITIVVMPLFVWMLAIRQRSWE